MPNAAANTIAVANAFVKRLWKLIVLPIKSATNTATVPISTSSIQASSGGNSIANLPSRHRHIDQDRAAALASTESPLPYRLLREKKTSSSRWRHSIGRVEFQWRLPELS